jgi:UDP-glucose 4-epimerase
MKIGIVGANGFVGSHIVNFLLSTENQVYAIYRGDSKRIDNNAIKVHINDIDKINYDCLIIAIGNHSSSHQEFLDQYNLIQFIINSCSFDRVIFISSSEVFGRHEEIIIPNSSFNNPTNYGLSKISQEFLVKVVKKSTIIRPTYLYGNGMNDNSLLPIWINKSKIEKQIKVFGDGSRAQDYLHIHDLCTLISEVISSDKTGVVLAASGISITNLQLAEMIANHFTGTTISLFGKDTMLSSKFDISLTIENYDWLPRMDLLNWISKR